MSIVKIKPGREKSIRNRHPWIFSGAIAQVKGSPAAGDVVTVVDRQDRFLARGHWNPASQIQVRALTFNDEPIDQDWWQRSIQDAVHLRQDLTDSTNAWRMINSENDFLPGLIVDRYADWLVLQASTVGMDINKWLIAEILSGLVSPNGIFERSDGDNRTREDLPAVSGVLSGEAPPDEIEIDEGARILVDVRQGHKTGFYLDQRVNRQRVYEIARRHIGSCRLLNLFCYTGGFALHALRAEGVHATNVDASADALEIARRNVALNGFEAGRAEFVQADAFNWLRDAAKKGESYDIIVLDPPKFAQSRAQVDGACRGYKDLNLSAFRLAKPGATMMTYSCSGAISAELFQKVVFSALADSGRNAQIIDRLGPGEDHPVSLAFPEGAYLKGLLLRVL